MIVLYPRASWDSHDCCLPPPKSVLPYQYSKELNQGLANSPAVSTVMTSDIKVTVFKPDSGELHPYLKPDQIHWQTPGRLWHTLKTDVTEWIERLRQTLCGHRWFGNVSGVRGSSSIRQSRSISAPALSFWMQRANWDRTWGPWLTPPKINENETSGSAWESERRFCTPLLLHRCQTQHGERFWLESDLKVVVWAIFCSYGRLGRVTIPNTLSSSVSPVFPPTSLNTFNYSAGD